MNLTVTDCYLRRGLSLKSKGSGARGPEWSGPCPDCSGDDRFLIWPEQNSYSGSYHCRGCGKSGDVIQFLRDFDGMSFQDAARAAGRPVENSTRSTPRMPKRTEDQGIKAKAPREATALWKQKATNFAGHCHEQLLENAEQLSWLAARGIPLEAVTRFRLGWNGCDGESHIYRPRKVWGLPDGSPRKPDGKPVTSLWLPRGLVIPAFGVNGQAFRLRIRRTDADRDASGFALNFYVVPGSGMAPLAVPQAGSTLPAASVAVLVESELDAMALAHAAGDLALIVALMMAKVRSLPPEILHAVKSCAVILAATDVGDKDGAGTKGASILSATFPQVKRWPCVGGKDPGEMAGNGKNLRQWVLAGLPDALVAIAMRHSMGHSIAPAQPSVPPVTEPEPMAEVPQAQPAAIQYPKDPALFPLRVHLCGRPEDTAARALHTLAVRGIVAHPGGEADFVLSGHDRMHGQDFTDLFFFIKHNGHHVARALQPA